MELSCSRALLAAALGDRAAPAATSGGADPGDTPGKPQQRFCPFGKRWGGIPGAFPGGKGLPGPGDALGSVSSSARLRQGAGSGGHVPLGTERVPKLC